MKSNNMKKVIIILCLTIFCSTISWAQMNFSFTPSTSIFTPITGGAVPFLIGNGQDPIADEGFATNIPIDFNFIYNSGNTYNEVSISTNGFISFAEITNATDVNNLTDGLVGKRPMIAPLWDDLNIQSPNNLKYVTTGTAPNRVFTVEWLNTRWGFGATEAAISFQVKLYETSNWVEFVYRQEAGAASSPSASVGLTTIGSGTGNFISLADLSATPAVSTNTEFTTITSKAANNQSYIFKAGTLSASIGSFSVSKEKNTHFIQWKTITEINNSHFELQRSNDGIQFNSIGTIYSKTNGGNSSALLSYSITDTKPLDGINYYRLKQLDKNGSIIYSSIISIKNSNSNWATLNVYPNPVKNKLNVLINNAEACNITIAIYNVYGQQMLLSKNSINNYANQVSVDVSNLLTGIYTLRVVNDKSNSSLTTSFVK